MPKESSDANEVAAPLEGVRIIDLTRVLAGPFATLLMAQLGAEVVKVEPPEGDPARSIPPFIGSESSYFLAVNSNKKSVVVDARTEEGRRVIHDMVRVSDACVDNFRPRSARKLGVDFATLKELNPRIVVCSISGFGVHSSMAERVAYDLPIQAMSGMMAVTGHRQGPPVRLGVPMADLIGGMNAALGMVAALKATSQDGIARHIDASLFDGTLSLLTYIATAALATGKEPWPVGSGHHSLVPYGAYAAEDGWIVVAVLSEKFWPRLCVALGLEDLAKDSELATNEGRLRRRAEVDAVVGARLATMTREEALRRLDKAEVACAPINSVIEALNHPLVSERGMVRNVSHNTIGSYQTLGPAIRVMPQLDQAIAPAPGLGEHTSAVLTEILGYTSEHIDRLADDRSIGLAEPGG